LQTKYTAPSYPWTANPAFQYCPPRRLPGFAAEIVSLLLLPHPLDVSEP
jgi:hypothetical protein